MKKRISFDECFMKIAKTLALRSSDPKIQVGCLLVSYDYRAIIGIGYNGSVTGQSNERRSLEEGQSSFIHAEINCLINNRSPLEQGLLFVTHAPCEDCARAIANSNKVLRVYYNKPYKNNEGLAILKRSGIVIEKI